MRNAARTTIRLLESMIRIAEAHARLMFREEVTIQDAVMAVCIMECSMQNTALLQGLMNPLHTSFPQVLISQHQIPLLATYYLIKVRNYLYKFFEISLEV